MKDNLYLKENVLVEPLINQWYAWSCLIPPATASMYIANQHLKIMQSFVSAPQVHVSSLKNPAMIGGPFINYDASRVGEIRSLLGRTTDENADLIRLAEEIKKLDEMLQSEATGYSLEPLYQRVPGGLKGYVELTYDLNNHPSTRFIEGLLYNSPYYKKSNQSVALSLIDRDYRPFVFSTPRLEGDGRLHVPLPFNHEGFDELFKMKHTPSSYDRIKSILEIRNGDDELFSSFFTEQTPQKCSDPLGEGARVRYFGHACLLLESNRTSILCDPLVSYKYDNGIYRYTYADLPDKIDYVVITHNHQDHCMFETLLQLRHKIRNILVPKNNGGSLADPSLKLMLQKTGFKNVTEIDEMESIKFEGGAITGIPFLGEHGDLNIRTKMGYLINLKGTRAFIAADSNNIEPNLYKHVHEISGDVDLMFVGMECDGAPLSWICGPLLTKPLSRKMDQSRRLDGSNFEKARRIVAQLNPRQVYVYAMGQEPWLTYLTSIQYTEESKPITESNRLIEDCRQRGITSERLFGYKEIRHNAL
jgi:L-ascorbate metabolism protein UlaG (beta-lactamase superfamily)